MKKSRIIFQIIFSLAFSCPLHAQIITTIAGNGHMGYSGDGGQATAAELYLPNAVAVDSMGNLYISESDYYVRKISVTGIITTFAGNGSAVYSGDGMQATATALLPGGIAIDKIGNVYISDGFNHRVLKVDTTGIITTYAGNGIEGYTGDGGPATLAKLGGPGYIALDGSGNLYIGSDSNVIRKVNAAGIITTIAGNGIPGFSGDGGPATAAQLNVAEDVSADSIGNIYMIRITTAFVK